MSYDIQATIMNFLKNPVEAHVKTERLDIFPGSYIQGLSRDPLTPDKSLRQYFRGCKKINKKQRRCSPLISVNVINSDLIKIPSISQRETK